jgi:hypothetical protein
MVLPDMAAVGGGIQGLKISGGGSKKLAGAGRWEPDTGPEASEVERSLQQQGKGRGDWNRRAGEGENRQMSRLTIITR